MAHTRIERAFPVSPRTLFETITSAEGLRQWWGTDTTTLGDHQLDFTRLGPWHSTMLGKDGGSYKMSGQVTSVAPPHSVGFTWAWHDADDARGPETHVTFSVSATADGGARLTIDHRDFPDDEAAARHNAGWSSVLDNLQRKLPVTP